MGFICEASGVHSGNLVHHIVNQTEDGVSVRRLFTLCGLHLVQLYAGFIRPAGTGPFAAGTPDATVIGHALPAVGATSPFVLASEATTFGFSTLKAVLDSIAAGDVPAPSETVRYVVLVSPGKFTEDNSAGPLSVPSFVSAVGLGPPEQTVVRAGTPSNDLLRFAAGANDAGLARLTLENVTTAGKSAVVNESGNRRVYCRDLRFKDAKAGIRTRAAGSFTEVWNCEAVSVVDFPFVVEAGANTQARLFSCTVRPPALAQVGYYANGGSLVAQNCHVEAATVGMKADGAAGDFQGFSMHVEACPTGLLADGAGAFAQLHGSHVQKAGGTATDGIKAVNGGLVFLKASEVRDYVNAVRLGTGGNNRVVLSGSFLRGSTSKDVLSDANPGFVNTLELSATNLDPAKVTVDAATFAIVDLLRQRPAFIGTPEPSLYAGFTLIPVNAVRYAKVEVELFVKVSGVQFRPNGTQDVRLGLYRDSDGSKVAETALTSVSAGVQTLNFTGGAVFLTRGTYWAAYVGNGPLQVFSLDTQAAFAEAQNEAGPGGGALPAAKAGTNGADKLLMRLATVG